MQIYLVGGAVRDELLGLKPKDRDWVVVGATDDDMLKLGYKPIFSSFPVFIDPKTKEEYALARTERKISSGYHGFKINSNPSITLKQDLERRDLTLNSIAKTIDGNIIDPFNGQQDIKNRILRHTSLAFKEDPLRVIRLARFKAQLSDFHFTIAPETIEFVSKMLSSNELNHLTKERLHLEFIKSLKDPAIFFKCLRALKVLQTVFPNIYKNINLLHGSIFFQNNHYKKLSIDEKTASTFYNFPIESLKGIRDELNLTKNQHKLLLACASIYQIITTNIQAPQILQLIKSANILRNQQLYNSASKIIQSSLTEANYLIKLIALQNSIDEILGFDLRQLAKSTPADQLKTTIEKLQTDTINKYIKV
jgi:tRNA nucleotidyltransferase (CCA-adding enzyme)